VAGRFARALDCAAGACEGHPALHDTGPMRQRDQAIRAPLTFPGLPSQQEPVNFSGGYRHLPAGGVFRGNAPLLQSGSQTAIHDQVDFRDRGCVIRQRDETAVAISSGSTNRRVGTLSKSRRTQSTTRSDLATTADRRDMDYGPSAGITP